jgi:hypothetical protein
VLLTTSTVALTACSAPWRSLRPMPELSFVIRTSPLVPFALRYLLSSGGKRWWFVPNV